MHKILRKLHKISLAYLGGLSILLSIVTVIAGLCCVISKGANLATAMAPHLGEWLERGLMILVGLLLVGGVLYITIILPYQIGLEAVKGIRDRKY